MKGKIIAICLLCATALTGAFAQEGFRVGHRKVEIGLLNMNARFSSKFVKAGDLLSGGDALGGAMDDLLDMLVDGLGTGKLNTDLGVGLTPLYFSYARIDAENPWGFGLAVDVEASGAINSDVGLNVGASAFLALRASSFFGVPTTPEIGTFKVRASPSLFFPLIYSDPGSTKAKDLGGGNGIDYEMKIFTAIKDGGGLNWSPGLDLSLAVEHPLSETLGLSDVSPLLNFKVGLDFVNIPIVAGRLREYMEISGNTEKDEGGALDGNPRGTGEVKTRRPFRMHGRIEWSPFETVPVSFTPVFGLAVNPIYTEPTSPEGGLRTRYDFRNLLIGSFGLGYFDRAWRTDLGLAFNLKYFELDLGYSAALSGGGFGASLGFKFGW